MVIDDSNLEIATVFTTQDTVFNQAKAYWLFGEWEKLAAFANADITEQPEKATLSLLISAAFLQLDNSQQAEYFLQQARTWQVNNKLVAKVLVAGMHNSLGRMAALTKDDSAIEKHFFLAVDIGYSNTEMVAHARAIREMASLGLLPQAAGLVSSKIKHAKDNPSKIKNIDAHISVLETELGLLNHELSISQQRLQLYRTDNTDLQLSNTNSSEDYIERLKRISVSQLGQDLWVLEKTNYKRGGFFVEFGAADGVLLSNTYLLEKEFGWDGICAEPNPEFFKMLKKNRRCVVSDACIFSETGNTVEFICAQEFGSINEYSADDLHSKKRDAFKELGKTISLETISLEDFLKVNNAPKKIDYISIDTEGSEFDIISNFPLNDWDVNLISIEHNYTDQREKIFRYMNDNGYNRIESEWDDWYFKVL